MQNSTHLRSDLAIICFVSPKNQTLYIRNYFLEKIKIKIQLLILFPVFKSKAAKKLKINDRNTIKLNY